MDTTSKLYIRIAENEDLIEKSIEDGHPELVEDYQEEIDLRTIKLKHLESNKRKLTNKKKIEENGLF